MRRRVAHLVNRCSTLLVVVASLVHHGRGLAASEQDVRRDLSEVTKLADALRAEQYAIASELIKRHPEEFDALRIMGYVHSSHGNLKQMSECWQKCRQLQPDRADIYDQLGRYEFQAERYKEAIENWKMALKINPKLTGVLQQVGNALLNLGQAEAARQALHSELERSPRSSQAYYLLGEALFQLEDFASAKKAYLAATKLSPTHRRAFYGLIKTCTRLGQVEDATAYAKEFQRLESAADQADLEYRRQFDDLQQMREKLAVTCVDAGRVYLQDQDTETAERLWSRAATLDPKNVPSRSLLAGLFNKRRQLNKALQQYQQLAQLQPRNVEHQEQIGMLHARTGNPRAAETAFRKMVELAPENAAGYRMLAKFYLNTNQQSALAFKLSRQAVKLEPIGESYFVLGWSSAKLGKLADAVAALTEATRLDPKNARYRQLHELVQKSRQSAKQKGN